MVEFASASRDGRSLTLSFPGAEAGSGPCSASYRGFVAASPSAVAVDAPLGDRLVVDVGGRPVPVCPPGAPVRPPRISC